MAPLFAAGKAALVAELAGHATGDMSCRRPSSSLCSLISSLAVGRQSQICCGTWIVTTRRLGRKSGQPLRPQLV
eukprot:2197416-Prymnesium_polylepis.1